MAEDSLQAFTSKESALLGWIHDFAPYGVITTDAELKVQSWNRWMETHSGLRAEDVIGDPLLDLFPDIVERRLSHRLERALHGEISVLSTALHGHLIALPSAIKSSGFNHMQQTARIGPLVQGQVVLGIIITLEDVTQREMQAAILRRQHERSQILSWALAHLLRAGNPRRTVRELFFKVAEHFDYEAYFLYLKDGAEELSLHDTGGLSPEVQNAFIESKMSRYFWGNAELSKPVIVRDSSAWPAGSGIKVAIAVPLAMGEASLGVLCFATKSRDTIQEGEIELLSTIAQYLAISIHRSNTDLQLLDAKEKLLQHADNLEREVAVRTARLREIVSELEIFSYSMAHDLRAPIRALIGYCEVLKEDYEKVIPAEPMDIIARLSRACSKLDFLTRDLLQFSKISRADIELHKVCTDDVVKEVLSIYPPQVRECIKIAWPLHDVVAHHGLLHQCIANLIENALKFVAKGELASITIRTEVVPESTGQTGVHSLPFSKAVYAQLRPHPNLEDPAGSPVASSTQRIKLWVVDKGIGIPEGAHEKIFGIFERATSSEEFPGTGIGLAIVARAVERMDGRCGVESSPAGSRFWLELHPAEAPR